MPIWNTREDHLREAVESILHQSFEDFEYLILNDSPDNTKLDEIVASYGDLRIRYERNEQNMGITPSRNKLLQMAEGEYIAIFDHDDISDPTRLEKQVAYLDAHPEVGVLGSWVREFPLDKTVRYPENDEEIRMGPMWGCVVPHSAAMVRRKVLEEHGIMYEERFSPSEDYALWCQLIPHTQFHNLPEVLFRYRMHANNTSKSQATRMDNATYAIRAFVKADNPAIILPQVPDWQAHVFHLFPIRCKRRDEFQQYLADNGMQTVIHYPIPPHKQECYKEWNDQSYPITEQIHNEELSLPISPTMSITQAETIVQILNSFSLNESKAAH